MKEFLSRYNSFLDSNKRQWLIGDTVSTPYLIICEKPHMDHRFQVTWADIALAEYLSVCEDGFDSDLLSGYPKLKNFVQQVFELPRIKEYIQKREKTMF